MGGFKCWGVFELTSRLQFCLQGLCSAVTLISLHHPSLTPLSFLLLRRFSSAVQIVLTFTLEELAVIFPLKRFVVIETFATYHRQLKCSVFHQVMEYIWWRVWQFTVCRLIACSKLCVSLPLEGVHVSVCLYPMGMKKQHSLFAIYSHLDSNSRNLFLRRTQRRWKTAACLNLWVLTEGSQLLLRQGSNWEWVWMCASPLFNVPSRLFFRVGNRNMAQGDNTHLCTLL